MDASQAQAPAQPRVTVILIAHDQAAALERGLKALEASHDRAGLEIIVVDCASTDNTAALAERHPSVTMLRLPQQFGATRALNIAVRSAKADMVLFLSPQVEIAPNTIPQLIERLDNEAGTAAVCPLLTSPDHPDEPASRFQDLPEPASLRRVCSGVEPQWRKPDLAQESVPVDYPGRDALLVRKQFLLGMNYFDQRFGEYWADADLALQIRRAQRQIRLYPSIRATLHPSVTPPVDDTAHRADRILGAAILIQKHYGLGSATRFRIAMALGALIRLKFPLLTALLGGKKVGTP